MSLCALPIGPTYHQFVITSARNCSIRTDSKRRGPTLGTPIPCNSNTNDDSTALHNMTAAERQVSPAGSNPHDRATVRWPLKLTDPHTGRTPPIFDVPVIDEQRCYLNVIGSTHIPIKNDLSFIKWRTASPQVHRTFRSWRNWSSS